jgi:hypothetical protein
MLVFLVDDMTAAAASWLGDSWLTVELGAQVSKKSVEQRRTQKTQKTQKKTMRETNLKTLPSELRKGLVFNICTLIGASTSWPFGDCGV